MPRHHAVVILSKLAKRNSVDYLPDKPLIQIICLAIALKDKHEREGRAPHADTEDDYGSSNDRRARIHFSSLGFALVEKTRKTARLP